MLVVQDEAELEEAVDTFAAALEADPYPVRFFHLDSDIRRNRRDALMQSYSDDWIGYGVEAVPRVVAAFGPSSALVGELLPLDQVPGSSIPSIFLDSFHLYIYLLGYVILNSFKITNCQRFSRAPTSSR